jgi:hypothetical protein
MKKRKVSRLLKARFPLRVPMATLSNSEKYRIYIKKNKKNKHLRPGLNKVLGKSQRKRWLRGGIFLMN